ncbi:MAG TPA: hypothetical protein PL048_08745 [Leptospiraceae bacterium]|nr:hypothetical protein [Leptospiraceae bacterium]HMZ58850.1 hypothetical protein [Leptospiraceae bacterium]HNI26281.1 hypothetical protein [Leptospiraceae bacterium]HNI95177.1 hypothetical protein [Leptospiraceae bacterium]HNM04859.1 hypothetical protein [Leptospiraceae bacterium]
MQFYKVILNWLDSLRESEETETSVGRHSENPDEAEFKIVFNLQKSIPSKEDWIKAFNESAQVSSVTFLRVDMKTAVWDNDILALCERIFPNLTNLYLSVKGSKGFILHLNFSRLNFLEINLIQKPSNGELSLQGKLPSLKTFTFQHSGNIEIDKASLNRLLLSSECLESVNLYCKHSWNIAEEIAESVSRRTSGKLPVLTLRNSVHERNSTMVYSRTETEKNNDQNSLIKLLKLKVNIDFDSAVIACSDRENFILVSEYLDKKTDHLNLDGSVHSFLLREPELLKDFSSIRNLYVFGAQELSQKNFQKLCDILPCLTAVSLINNHHPEFRSLCFRSETLKELYLTHFHTLETFDIHSDSLEILELDNCSDSSTVEYPEKNMRWCNGFFGEKFLSALLNGDRAIHLPNLKSLYIWHNHNGFGPPLVYENRRMDIECTAGHSKLEELVISRLSHIRNLTLKKLPSLRKLSVFDDFEENQGWMEKLDASDLSKDCEVNTDGHSGPSRKAEDIWWK